MAEIPEREYSVYFILRDRNPLRSPWNHLESPSKSIPTHPLPWAEFSSPSLWLGGSIWPGFTERPSPFSLSLLPAAPRPPGEERGPERGWQVAGTFGCMLMAVQHLQRDWRQAHVSATQICCQGNGTHRRAHWLGGGMGCGWGGAVATAMMLQTLVQLLGAPTPVRTQGGFKGIFLKRFF